MFFTHCIRQPTPHLLFRGAAVNHADLFGEARSEWASHRPPSEDDTASDEDSGGAAREDSHLWQFEQVFPGAAVADPAANDVDVDCECPTHTFATTNPGLYRQPAAPVLAFLKWLLQHSRS